MTGTRLSAGILCLAKTRQGTPCQKPPLNGKTRCRLHGGLSTGPKTPEGKARIVAALGRVVPILFWKDVHHKDGNPRNNKSSNVAVVSRKKNRGKYRFA